MAAKKCCERCERFIVFNCVLNHGVCCKTMNVVQGSDICDHYAAKKRKRGAQNDKADSSAESNR